jgi:hypothetical protein
LTTLSCSASGIFAICCDLTRPTITPLARTFQSARTRRRREQHMPLVAFCLRHLLADFIICICVFDFQTQDVGNVLSLETLVVFERNRDPIAKRSRTRTKLRFWEPSSNTFCSREWPGPWSTRPLIARHAWAAVTRRPLQQCEDVRHEQCDPRHILTSQGYFLRLFAWLASRWGRVRQNSRVTVRSAPLTSMTKWSGLANRRKVAAYPSICFVTSKSDIEVSRLCVNCLKTKRLGGE